MELPPDEGFLNHKFCIAQSQTFTIYYIQMSDTKALEIQTVYDALILRFFTY